MNECKSDPPIETVFASGMEGAACYRIPSILQAPTGTLLAFAEQRLADCGDNGENNIVLRRREKGGDWGEIQVVGEWREGEASRPTQLFNPAHPPLQPCPMELLTPTPTPRSSMTQVGTGPSSSTTIQ